MPRILIVEDDPILSRLYQRVFALEGYDVEAAIDGRDALVKVAACIPSVMLLDIMMPNMNGLQVLDRLKADKKTSGIPVVVLTNLAGVADAKAALDKGARKYVIKSEYEPKQVVAMVKDVLRSG